MFALVKNGLKLKTDFQPYIHIKLIAYDLMIKTSRNKTNAECSMKAQFTLVS